MKSSFFPELWKGFCSPSFSGLIMFNQHFSQVKNQRFSPSGPVFLWPGRHLCQRPEPRRELAGPFASIFEGKRWDKPPDFYSQTVVFSEKTMEAELFWGGMLIIICW